MKALFLGAGASYELGLPLVWELTSEIKNWLTPQKLTLLNEHWKNQDGGRPKEVIDLFNELLSTESMHYESIIGAIEVEIKREKNREISQELHGMMIWLLDIIYFMLYTRQVKNKKYIEEVIKDLYAIEKLAKENNPLWVFSLNHDINLEIIASEYNIPVKSGFLDEFSVSERDNQGNITQKLSFEYLSRKDIDNGNFSFYKEGEYGINLVKLHGALDIFANKDELNYLKIKPDSLTCSGYIDALRRANEKLSPHLPVKATNEILYTDDNGVIQFLRKTLLSGAYKFESSRQLAPPEFLKLFTSNINQVSELICIGYGFGDAHIDNVIRKWLSFSIKRSLNIVNPTINTANKLPNPYLHLSRQIQFSSYGFIEFMLSLDNKNDSITKKGLRKIRATIRDRMKKNIEESN